MEILDNFLILALHVLCFIAGMKISDKYHHEKDQQVERQVRLAQARIRANDYAPYVAPVERKYKAPIGAPFVDRINQNGRATQQINPDKPIS